MAGQSARPVPVSEPAAPARRSKISPEREREFFAAVLDQLREHGYESVTMEGVAARVRCGKSTLYRQWGSKPRFVAAALRSERCPRFAGIDTGSLAGDLRAAAHAAGTESCDDTRLLHALGHTTLQDHELQRALCEALVEPELAALDAMLARAEARGEIGAAHPAAEYVAALLFGVTRVRPQLEGRFADPAYLIGLVDAVILPAFGLTAPPRPAADGASPAP
ncbi:TetR/AcrR family transcriptional regulator C-terminal ligand-binding domain-containing protein [Streptomyces sp. LE64]|uniref:TetR/AcrR family transcriptional regulator C-terminal ligand-binding domain-containing protein n=1 Tax=Streptomyces sp. LE64 TaxID=3448653 RepID=UPI0040432D46